MTHQIFNLPPQQPLSAAGRVLPGAKAHFYLTGTSTPTPVYTTSALSVAHAQPVVADAGGRFSAIFLDPSIVYKVTVTDSNDTLLYTVDPANDQTLSAASVGILIYPRSTAEISAGVTPTNYQYPHGYIERYGNNSTPGTTDMSAALASASAQAAAGGADINALTICHIASETEVAALFRVGRRQCFTTTSIVTFALGAVNAIYPEWWGAKADAAVDASSGTQCQDAFEAAITASTQDGDGAVSIHPISLGPGNYRIDGLGGLLPPAFKMYGLGIHVSTFAINSGATGNVISDSGSASKVELRDFAVYCNNRAGLTNGINLGNDTVDYGTEGYISDLWVRDLPAGAPGFYIRGNVG
jgi:hypothetical protein